MVTSDAVLDSQTRQAGGKHVQKQGSMCSLARYDIFLIRKSIDSPLDNLTAFLSGVFSISGDMTFLLVKLSYAFSSSSVEARGFVREEE